MKYIIKNGTVVNADGSFKADVLVENGLVAGIGESIPACDAETVDASGCYVMPGFIDTHTHFDLSLGYTSTADDFITGGKAAVRGGTTAVLDFATADRGSSLRRASDTWHEKARGCSTNYGFHMALAEWNSSVEAELPEMTKAGITSYKLYMVYSGLKLDDGEIYSALKAIKKEGALTGVHCENWDVLLRIASEVKESGVTGPEGHPVSRPNDVEAEAVARLMRIARLADAPVYVVHLSTAEGLGEALRARARGQEVYLETCPQYLSLTDERYSDPDGAKYVMSPPLRKQKDVDALWEAVSRGDIDFIGTDHCSFTMLQKAHGRDDFSLIPNGGAGVRWRGELIYTLGVLKGRLAPEDMVRLLSYNPAKLFGMEGRGEIKNGAVADIVIWDGSAQRTILDSDREHNCDNSPYAGFDVFGRAKEVLLNGEHIIRNGELVSEGRGRFIPCGRYTKTR